jgi:hypothetical protein
MIFTEGGAGRPNKVSMVFRSLKTVGEPKESINAMVSPAPVYLLV